MYIHKNFKYDANKFPTSDHLPIFSRISYKPKTDNIKKYCLVDKVDSKTLRIFDDLKDPNKFNMSHKGAIVNAGDKFKIIEKPTKNNYIK